MIKKLTRIAILILLFTLFSMFITISVMELNNSEKAQRIKVYKKEAKIVNEIQKEDPHVVVLASYYVELYSKPVIEYDPPETVYDYYTAKEIEMLERVVEAEATGGTVKEKMNVANVLYNRINSERFPNTVKGVVFAHNQFSCVSDRRYYKRKISKSTIEAVERAFMEKDTTRGALFFCNKRDVRKQSTKRWFKKLTYIMTDDIGHSFYK